MANETQDPRALLAKMQADEKAAQEKLDKIKADNATKSAELLAQLRKTDLEDVLEKCKLHGFTATDLKSALKTKAVRKTPTRKTTSRKTSTRKKAAG